MGGASAASAGGRAASMKAMEHPEMDVMVSQQLKRLWSLLSEMDAAHLQRLARAAGKARSGKSSHGRHAA
jgi:hypothetical protein